MAARKHNFENVVIGHLNSIKDRFFGVKRSKVAEEDDSSSTHGGELGSFDTLPVGFHLIFLLLSPHLNVYCEYRQRIVLSRGV